MTSTARFPTATIEPGMMIDISTAPTAGNQHIYKIVSNPDANTITVDRAFAADETGSFTWRVYSDVLAVLYDGKIQKFSGNTFDDHIKLQPYGGNVGIGTTSPYAKLSVVDASASADTDIFAISTSTSGAIFRVTGYGNVYADGTYYGAGGVAAGGADYAEYFWTKDVDLTPGETVCVDITRDNAVKRCEATADGNVMGIISTKPAIVGNSRTDRTDRADNYVIVGLLGQVPAKVSGENGAIRPGDSLTPASIPGYVMRADAGDSTVGVALEAFGGGEIGQIGQNRTNNLGTINVLISRRNKSLTVETVEEQITKRIADMEIEDEVAILIADATKGLPDEIKKSVDEQLAAFGTGLTVKIDEINGKIANSSDEIIRLIGRMGQIETANIELIGRAGQIEEANLGLIERIGQIEEQIGQIDLSGNLKLGNNIATGTPEVAIVEIGADSDKPAFVVNQAGEGDVADLQADGVSIMNVAGNGKVTIVGEMLVDGRIMVCSGGACGAALDSAVDETMGDMGVEGKVVAGAFEGYCDDGFIWAPGSAKYGTLPGFCVQAEKAGEETASGDGTDRTYRTNISQGEAQLSCQSLGKGYHLISENEWMTIAENILRAADNDVNSDEAGMQLATSTDDGTNRTYSLTNGNIIYDLVGEIGEWTDQTVTKAGIFEPVSDEWQEYYDITDYKGFNIAPPYYYTSANGIGRVRVGDNENNLRGFVRGLDGVFSLDLSNSPTTATSTISFRCAK